MHFPDSEVDVLVIGSVNVDMGFRLERQPRTGETVASVDMTERGGGKGANQAFAAARAAKYASAEKQAGTGSAAEGRNGGTPRVSLLAAVGTEAETALADLRQVDVDLSGLVTIEGVPTGCAVLLLAGGDNTIIVSAGANAHLTPQHVSNWASVHTAPKVVVLQHEVQQEVVTEAVREFSERSTVILNPSPWREEGRAALAGAAVVVLNEIELEQVLGQGPQEGETPVQTAQRLIGQVPGRDAIVTLGGDGSVIRENGSITVIPAVKTTPVDSVGAGDAFLGTLATAVASGSSLVDAARLGAAAAAVVVTVNGARNLASDAN